MHTVIFVAATNECSNIDTQSTSVYRTHATVPAHYEVGCWQPADGNTDTLVSFFHNVKSFANAATAHQFCNYLNGGNGKKFYEDI